MLKPLKPCSQYIPFIMSLSFCAIATASERANTLREVLKDADRIVVKDVNQDFEPKPDADLHPFELVGEEKIATLVKGLDFNDERSGFHCMCDGDFNVAFYQGDKWLATLSYHHARSLRLSSKQAKWKGDSLFTPESAKAWREWFSANGDARFEKQYQEYVKEANRRREIHEKFLALFPKGAAEIFAGENNGIVAVVPQDDGDRPAEALSPAAQKLIALFPDKTKLGLAVAKGLGELCLLDYEGSWSRSTSREKLALECARTLNAAEFDTVLQSKDDIILLGTARLFFFEQLSELLPEKQRGPQAARLCEVVIQRDKSGNVDNALRYLGNLPCAETTALLERLAAGEITVNERDTDNKTEPASQAAACLLLARTDSKKTSKLIEKVAALPNLDDIDKAALKVARSLNGERGVLDKAIFKVNSGTVGFGALTALEKEGDTAALDAIIEGATKHFWAAVRIESVLAVERMTGQKWCKGGENERADWYTDEVQAWWKKNRDTFQLPAKKGK